MHMQDICKQAALGLTESLLRGIPLSTIRLCQAEGHMQLEAQGTARWQVPGSQACIWELQCHTRPTFGDEPHSSQSSMGASGSQPAMWFCVSLSGLNNEMMALLSTEICFGLHQKGLKALAPTNCC